MSKHKSVREALEFVAEHPEEPDEPVNAPVWELVSRTLFHVANSPDMRVRGSLARATKAQRIIADRLVGTRRPGTTPAQRRATVVHFLDLTAQPREVES